jgi:hypothetical protein
MPGTQPIEITQSSNFQKARLIGQKPPLKPREVWSIRVRLQIKRETRNLALFNLAIDSKLRSCDLVTLRVADIAQAGRVKDRGIVIQQKTCRPVQFELTEQTRDALADWIGQRRLQDGDYLFPSRVHDSPHLSTRQYARIVNRWVESIGLDPHKYGTHSMRRTKAALIYKKTGNLRAVQLLLGHTKLESTVIWVSRWMMPCGSPSRSSCKLFMMAAPYRCHHIFQCVERRTPKLAIRCLLVINSQRMTHPALTDNDFRRRKNHQDIE